MYSIESDSDNLCILPIKFHHKVNNLLINNYRFLEYLSKEIEKGKDIEWNLIWLRNILKYQEPTLSKFREMGHHGRSLMLRVYSSLQFYDQSLKKK